MKEDFQFETDAQAAIFCEAIANRMASLFGITVTEAIGRINQDWKGLKIISPDDVIYHEDEEYWAKTIYYGKGSNWWLNPPNLRLMNREQLKSRLMTLRIDPTAYSLTGGLPNECLVLNESSNGTWEVYYSERGEKSGLRTFNSEESAVQYFLDVILHDSAIRRMN